MLKSATICARSSSSGGQSVASNCGSGRPSAMRSGSSCGQSCKTSCGQSGKTSCARSSRRIASCKGRTASCAPCARNFTRQGADRPPQQCAALKAERDELKRERDELRAANREMRSAYEEHRQRSRPSSTCCGAASVSATTYSAIMSASAAGCSKMAVNFPQLVYGPCYATFARPVVITPVKSHPGAPPYNARYL